MCQFTEARETGGAVVQTSHWCTSITAQHGAENVSVAQRSTGSLYNENTKLKANDPSPSKHYRIDHFLKLNC